MSFPLVMLITLFGVQGDVALENTAIGSNQGSYTEMYNRLRGEATFALVNQPAFFSSLIVDYSSRYTEHPASFVNRTSIYRGYIGYGSGQSRVTLGKQRVPLGVGRIWNPIDRFNPINVEAVEVEERPGTECVRLEWAVSDLANLDVTLSRDKGEVRAKTYLHGADVGLAVLIDNDAKLDILGWELEGELVDTGIELRSEGGYFYDRTRHESYFETIVGAEYGLQNSLNVLVEYKYNDETKHDYGGSIISYQAGMLWNLAVLGLLNLDDDSSFLAPSAAYSLGDEMSLRFGCFVYQGGSLSEYGPVADRYYVRFFVHF